MKFAFRVMVFLVLVFSLGAAVSAFTVEIEAVNDTILPLQSASYLVTIDDVSLSEVINIRADATNWIVTPQSVQVGVNASETFELYITPRSGVGLSNYRIPLFFENVKTGQVVQDSVFLSLSFDLLSKGYPPNLDLQVEHDASVDPRKDFVVDLVVKNNNLREFDGLVVSVSGDLFDEERVTPLQPLGLYRESFSFDLDSLLTPGKYDLIVELKLPDDDKVYAQHRSSFTIQGYATIESSLVSKRGGLFTSVDTILLSNDGNRARSKEVSYSVGLFERWFVSTDPQGEFVAGVDGGRAYAWDISLDAQESSTIVIERDFTILAVIVAVLLLLFVSYFVFRSPVILLKEAQILSLSKHGESNELKVRVFVKNRSRRSVANIKIIDKVPRIAEMVAHAHLGTLQPTKVTKSDKRGTIIRWELESLEPFEERIISYRVRSKLKIVGQMTLPEARVKFDSAVGRERVASSGLGRIVD